MNNALCPLELCFSSPGQMLSPQVPTLVGYLGDQSLTEALLGALVDVSQASPSSLVSFLPTLRIVGQQSPALLGHVAKIHGAVGIISEVQNTAVKNTHKLPEFMFVCSADLTLIQKVDASEYSGRLQ